MGFKHFGIRIAAAAILALSAHEVALAQGFTKAKVSSEGGGSYRGFLFALPLTLTSESVGRLEFNLQGHAALGVEANFKRKIDDIDEETRKETGESLVTNGRGASILISRYSDGAAMAGFYWAIGAGYREMDADWRVRPESSDSQVDMSLVDDTDRLNHNATLKGGTAHVRIGYRYVGTDVPLSIGAYLGIRHFQADVSDETPKASASVTYANMTDKEKDRLARRYTTAPEPGIEFGIVF